MSFVHIKKRQINNENGEFQEVYAVQSMAIDSPQGRKLIPNPAGKEASLFDTFEEAQAAIERAGFDYIFEGRKTYLSSQKPARRPATSPHSTPGSLSGSIPILIQRLQDREPAVVSNAAFALGQLREPEAIPYLIECLGHEDSGVRKNVAESLAYMAPDAITPLQQAYETARRENSRNAAHIRLTVLNTYLEMTHTYRELMDTVMPQIIEALEDDNWLVRSVAAQVVGVMAKLSYEESER